MLLGRVSGTVVSTRKDAALVGIRFLLIEELDAAFKGTGRFVVAADAVGAGAGEVVLYASGSSARLTEVTKDRPVDAVLIGIVDQVEEDGRLAYDKSSDAPGAHSSATTEPSRTGAGRAR